MNIHRIIHSLHRSSSQDLVSDDGSGLKTGSDSENVAEVQNNSNSPNNTRGEISNNADNDSHFILNNTQKSNLFNHALYSSLDTKNYY